MIMLSGEHWHCTNPACRCGVLVETDGKIAGDNPRCVCGAAMKKDYSPPKMSYLDFLEVRKPVLAWRSPSER
jgi:hypothetical protein